jgi:hypothetical protein
MQCYYCCKHSHKSTNYKLQEQAKKICQENRKKSFKDDTDANTAIATTIAKTKDATIANAKL